MSIRFAVEKKAENLVVAQRGRHSLIKCYEEEKKRVQRKKLKFKKG